LYLAIVSYAVWSMQKIVSTNKYIIMFFCLPIEYFGTYRPCLKHSTCFCGTN